MTYPAATRSRWHRAFWLIAAVIVVLAGGTAAAAGLRGGSAVPPRPHPGYLLTATDAHFSATFPGKPQRTEKTTRTGPVIFYLAYFPDHAVEVIAAPVPASGSFSLDRAVNVIATAFPGGQVFSRHRLAYRGHPAEDAAISVLGNPGRIRVVGFGSTAYIFEGYGMTAASFAHDYQTLLDSFRLLAPAPGHVG